MKDRMNGKCLDKFQTKIFTFHQRLNINVMPLDVVKC